MLISATFTNKLQFEGCDKWWRVSVVERCNEYYNPNRLAKCGFHSGCFWIKHQKQPLYPCPAAGEHCPVLILDKYISKLPAEAKEKGIFNCWPLEKITSDPWYSAVPLGKNTLQAKLRKVYKCVEKLEYVGTKPIIACATAATQMFRQGAPKKVIQEQTGHCSIKALHSYERFDEVQHKVVSSLLSNTPGSSRSMTYSQHLMSIKNHTFDMSCTSYAPCAPIPSINLQDLHALLDAIPLNIHEFIM